MKKIYLTTLILFSICQFAFAQNVEPINTDRPDQSDGTYILYKDYLQIENGVTITNDAFVNNLMLRFGLTKSTEIRLLCNIGRIEGLKGLLPLGLSIKQRLIEQNNGIPAITLVGYLRNEQLASKDFKGNNTSASVLLAFQNDITDNLSVGYNIGTTTLFKDLNFTVSVGNSFSDKLTGYIEYFSHFEGEYYPQHNIDLGVLYLLNPNFQIDIALGRAMFSSDAAQFMTFGFSYRLNKRAKKDKM